MDKLTKFGNFLRSHSLFSSQSKKGVRTSSSGKVGLPQQLKSSSSAEQLKTDFPELKKVESPEKLKSNFSKCVDSMKNLLNSPTTENAKQFNTIVESEFSSLFADIGTLEVGNKNSRSGIEIFREASGINSMGVDGLRTMVDFFEKANQKGELNNYDPVIASMFFEAIKVRLAEEAKKSPNQGYDILAIKIQKVITDIMTPKQTDVQTKRLGSGVFNTVYKFETGQPPRTMIFKPENPKIEEQLGEKGEAGARSENRNVLTSRLARALGFGDTVVYTEFANINGQKGIVMEKAPGTSEFGVHTYTFKPNIFQKRTVNKILKNSENYYLKNNSRGHSEYALKPDAKARLQKYLGVSGDIEIQCFQFPDSSSHKNAPWNDPKPKLAVTFEARMPRQLLDKEYQRQSVELGLLDWIAGQTDRNVGNIVGGKGIDNDNSWNSTLLDLRNLQAKHIGRICHNVRPPLVVDTNMKASIEALSDEKLRASLFGYLTHAEIEAAVVRLHQVKEHLNSGNIAVIQPNQWGTDDVRDLLCIPEADDKRYGVWTSYLGRAVDLHEEDKKRGVEIMSPKEFEAFKKKHPLL